MALCSPQWLGAFLNPQPHGGEVSWAQCQQDMTAQPEDANKPPSLTGWPGAAARQAPSQRSSFRHCLLFAVIYRVDLTEEEVATSTQNLNHGSLKPPFTSRIAGKTDTYIPADCGSPCGTLSSFPQRILCFWNSPPALLEEALELIGFNCR